MGCPKRMASLRPQSLCKGRLKFNTGQVLQPFIFPTWKTSLVYHTSRLRCQDKCVHLLLLLNAGVVSVNMYVAQIGASRNSDVFYGKVSSYMAV
jgi:hypothetical protein